MERHRLGGWLSEWGDLQAGGKSSASTPADLLFWGRPCGLSGHSSDKKSGPKLKLWFTNGWVGWVSGPSAWFVNNKQTTCVIFTMLAGGALERLSLKYCGFLSLGCVYASGYDKSCFPLSVLLGSSCCTLKSACCLPLLTYLDARGPLAGGCQLMLVRVCVLAGYQP